MGREKRTGPVPPHNVALDKAKHQVAGGSSEMRIKGVPLEETAPGVRRLYEKNAEHLGRIPLPLTAFAHRPAIAEAYAALSGVLTRSEVVEPRLKMLACLRAAQIAGCPF